MNIHGNAAAVVHNHDALPFQYFNADVFGVAGHRLIDGVVHNFPDEMVQSLDSRGADIHSRSLANRL